MPSRQPPQPLDPPMVPVALGGLAAWAVAGLLVVAMGGPAQWLRICLAGFLIGLCGLAVMVRHDRLQARRHDRTA